MPIVTHSQSLPGYSVDFQKVYLLVMVTQGGWVMHENSQA